MAPRLEEPLHGGMAIHQLIVEAHNDSKRDRRSEVRYPFFRQVHVHSPDGCLCTAFSREISSLGIGLLHDVEFPPGEIELSVPSNRGFLIRVRTRIVWCQPCGEGWYISGGHFAGTAAISN